jgi:hypothetical protein
MEGSGAQPVGGAAAAAAAPKRNNMDYTLAALKLFGCQLAGATEAPPSESDGTSQAQMLYGIRFQRVWLQAGRGGAGGLPRRRRAHSCG